jgi:hypothetical protein
VIWYWISGWDWENAQPPRVFFWICMWFIATVLLSVSAADIFDDRTKAQKIKDKEDYYKNRRGI